MIKDSNLTAVACVSMLGLVDSAEKLPLHRNQPHKRLRHVIVLINIMEPKRHFPRNPQ